MGVFDFVKIFRVNKSISIDLGTANILIYDKQRKKEELMFLKTGMDDMNP